MLKTSNIFHQTGLLGLYKIIRFVAARQQKHTILHLSKEFIKSSLLLIIWKAY